MQKITLFMTLALCFCYFVSGQDDEDFAVSYDNDSFDAAAKDQTLFVMFFAPWCGHCKKLKPTWNDLAKEMNVDGRTVTIGKVDCTLHREVCTNNGVTGYPTLKFFVPGKEAVRYSSQRTMESFKAFIQTQLGEATPGKEPETAPPSKPAEATNGVYELTDDNFDAHIAKGHHFVKFFAPWCGHCKRLAPTWEAIGASFKDHKKVTIGRVDCTIHSKVCSAQGIRGYPTLMWFTDGKMFETYNQGRTEDAIHGYVSKIINIESEEARAVGDGKIPEVLDDLKDLNLVELTDEDFEETVSEDFTFVMFANKQCKSCELLKPALEDLGEKFAEKTEFLFAVVYCDEQAKTCADQQVTGHYPAFKLFHNGRLADTYTGDRTGAAIEDYMAKKEKELQPKKPDHGGEL